MKNMKLNEKLINLALLSFIIAVLFFTYPFWGGLIVKLFNIIFPFLISFAIAYALYPFLKRMQLKGIPKTFGIIILITIIITIITAICYSLIPIMYDQIASLIDILITSAKDLSKEYNIDLVAFEEKLKDIGTLTTQFGGDISNFGFSLINKSLNIFMLITICSIVSIYFLGEMQEIRNWIKKILRRNNNPRKFLFVKELDKEISNYFEGLELFMIIQFFEYTLAYLLIGHPYFLLMGILASVTTVIPYFGGIFSNIIAVITAALVSPKLFILSIIVTIILPAIDGYILSPKVYSKSNNMHPLIIIFSVFAGGILGGFLGIVISLPLAIIIICTYRFFEKDIIRKIKDYND